MISHAVPTALAAVFSLALLAGCKKAGETSSEGGGVGGASSGGAGAETTSTGTGGDDTGTASAGTGSTSLLPPDGSDGGSKSWTTDSGLQIEQLAEGDGSVAEAGNMVEVHYTGWLTDGTKFDSSVDRGQPFKFPLGAGRVIKGWDEGVAGMKIGEKRKLTIPSDLGYGPSGTPGGPIPPNATLVFEVELLGVQ